jgi:hypothetical protein
MQAAPAETAPAQVAGNDGNDALTGVAAESGAAPDAAGATDVASSADALLPMWLLPTPCR